LATVGYGTALGVVRAFGVAPAAQTSADERRGRPDDEVVRIAGERIAPDGVPAANRAFDVTPARLVTAFVTERGVLRPLYTDALRAAASA